MEGDGDEAICPFYEDDHDNDLLEANDQATADVKNCEDDCAHLDVTKAVDTSSYSFKKDKQPDPNTWITLKDGSKYKGEWEDNKRQGRGDLISPDGAKYSGNWLNDLPHGFGERIGNGLTYKGEFLNGLANGKGDLWYNRGGHYQGTWQNGIKHGKNCKEEWADGTVYTGDFENDNMHGTGLIIYPNSSVYSGEFRDGKISGKGVLVWTGENSRRFEGDWVDGDMEGYGVLKWMDGSKYEGQFKVSKMQGKGCLTKDGIATDGIWENGNLVQMISQINVDGEIEVVRSNKSEGGDNQAQLISIVNKDAIDEQDRKKNEDNESESDEENYDEIDIRN